MSLDGKNALVTGASRGIGQACAQMLAADGAQVIVSDLLDCANTVDMINEAGGSVRDHLCNVADESSVLELFQACFGAKRKLDYLVHCAGIIDECALLDTTAEQFDRVIAVNLRGSFLIGREALRLMWAQQSGRVTVIASDLSYYGRESFSTYVASKHGVMGLVKSWAHEFAPSININAICPGPVNTQMLDAENMSEQWRNKELEIPLARFAEPEEVARLALFLAGPGGDFITGQGLGINGGSIMI